MLGLVGNFSQGILGLCTNGSLKDSHQPRILICKGIYVYMYVPRLSVIDVAVSRDFSSSVVEEILHMVNAVRGRLVPVRFLPA